jgi:hypothetical protein
MRTLRAGISALLLAAAATSLVACTGEPTPGEPPTGAPSAGAPSSAAATAAPSAAPTSRGPAPSSSAEPTPADPQPTGSAPASPDPQPTSSDQPVPKVGRSGAATSPTVSAEPAKVDGTVRYRDGVSLRVVSVDFAKETKKGPGSFPGRAYAVLELQIANKSDKNLSLDTVVVTVLDRSDQPVAPVYTDEAEVSDFAGVLRAGRTVTARYAFAVPASSRSKVTVVVDFDGVHTSAVFRGKLD